LPRLDNPRVLVGFDKSDDAGVYLLDDRTALVQTIDFFTPIVDDPETFGQVAAANSLSDVYAMGGRPVTALSVTCFPGDGDPAVLEAILRGGQSKIHEAGCVVIGGHSVADDEIKFGYAVIGTIDPAKIRTNSAARPGDDLVLTKRLGTGVISTALKREAAAQEHVDAMVESMTQLNRVAGEALGRYNVHAATDITGFGLMGHGREMALGSNVTLEIDHSKLEFLPGALDYARQGIFPGGQKNNKLFAQAVVWMADSVPAEVAGLLYDPQTSGGLLISIEPADAGALLHELHRAGVVVGKIGRVLERGTVGIRVV
jgi:selenide, water dikinase